MVFIEYLFLFYFIFQQTSIYMTEIKVHFWQEGRKDKRVKHNIFILYFPRLLLEMTP